MTGWKLYRHIIITGVWVIHSFISFAQVLTFEKFIVQVKQHHPVAKQARLKILYGEANLLKSRGFFDPKIASDIAQKYYDNKQYYSHITAEFKVPTWFGIELKALYENNFGSYLNSELTTPRNGLIATGINIPVGQRLLMDERRTELKKAKVFLEISENERQILLNDILKEASLAYWNWYKTYHKMKIYEEVLNLSKSRLEFVKNEALIGEAPMMDTLEAFIQYSNRLLMFRRAEQEYFTASRHLEKFLWQEGIIPLELQAEVIPVSIEETTFASADNIDKLNLDSLLVYNPKIQKTRNYIQQKQIELRLYKEYLKPRFDLQYYPLVEPLGNDFVQNYSLNNYKWGVDFSIPILYRKERGQITAKNLEIKEAEMQLEFMQLEYFKDIQSIINTIENTYTRILISEKLVSDGYQLLMNEKELFEAGESSLFKLNNREVYYLKYKTDFVDIITDNKKSEIYFYYTYGNLFDKF
jgi:outer membrane protein TolC